MTLGVFVTSTVAWFDISNNLIVNNLSLSFSDDKGIKVAFSDGGEEYSIADATILEKETNYHSSDALYPVTSAFQSKWLNEKTSFAGTTPILRVGPQDGEGVADKGFIQLPLYFVTPQDGYIYLDASTSFLADQAENEKTARRLKLNLADLNKIQGCIRVSFYSDDFGFKIFEPNVAVSSNTLLGGRLDINPFDGYFDYNEKTKREILFGDYNKDADPTLFYGLASADDTKPEGEVDCFHSGTKAGIAPLDIESSTESGGLLITQEKTYPLSDMLAPSDGMPGGNPVTYCVAGEPHKVIVTIYVEGWDFDTVASIVSSSVSMNLSFTAMYAPKISK
jgi:hypothetical protein